MANKQLFAKFGVFLLLGVNVAAYWFFWPNYRGNTTKASTQEKGETRLLPGKPEKEPEPPQPRELPRGSLADATPLQIPTSTPKAENLSDDERIRMLIDRINNDKKGTTPVVAPMKNDVPPLIPIDTPKVDGPKFKLPTPPIPMPPPPMPPMDSTAPKTLPPLVPAGSVQNSIYQQPPSPWLKRQEAVGQRTELTLRLQPTWAQKPLTEFRMHCDRVKDEPTQLVATGRVLFNGGGLQGQCDTVTVLLRESTLIFEGNVQVADPSASGYCYRTERLVWGNTPAQQVEQKIIPALGIPK